MSIDDALVQKCRVTPEQMLELGTEVFGTEAGKQYLSYLLHAISPMAPSADTGSINDAHAVGMREGRREFSAFLFRTSGTCPAV